jgi:hypothetical protein
MAMHDMQEAATLNWTLPLTKLLFISDYCLPYFVKTRELASICQRFGAIDSS